MNNSTIKVIGFGLLVLGSQAFAIDRPAPLTKTVQPGSEENMESLEVLPKRNVNVAGKRKLLLGVVPGEMPPALKVQMNLDGFSGVLVEDIIPGSPADKAGIKKYDVIIKVGEKPISKPVDMRDAVADADTGDKVIVELLRAMKPHQVELALDQTMAVPDHSSNEVPPLRKMPHDKFIDDAIGAGRMTMPRHICDDKEIEEIFDMFSEIMSRTAKFHHPSAAGVRIERLRRQMQQLESLSSPSGIHNPPGGRVIASSQYSSSIFRRDSEGSIEIKNDSNSGTRLTVRDLNGNVVFNGPYTTADDKSKVPDQIRARLDGICSNIQQLR